MRRRFGENILNYVLYQTGWFACVLGASGGRPWLGMTAGLLLTAVHVVLARSSGRELALVLLAGGLGAILDTLQMQCGVLRFPTGHLVAWLCPPWIVVMWMQFATLFHFALSWMGGRYALSALLGLVGGPLAFFTGERLGAVTFPAGPWVGYGSLAIIWAVATPALVWLADKTRGAQPGYRIFQR